MKKVYTAFWWHQHQPYYKSDFEGDFLMPWVRLHGVKDYIGMINLLSEFPAIRANINYTPSLLLQLNDYINGNGTDTEYFISKKQITDLTEEDKKYIIKNFFRANEDNLIGKYTRYRELFEKKRFLKSSSNGMVQFSDTQIMDLIVLFNLSWIHETEIQSDKQLKAIVEKGKHFNEQDRDYILDKHLDILKKIIPLHKEFYQKGQVEITTTPFYHPILPLLMNMDSAREAMPDVILPGERIPLKEDALIHLSKGIQYAKDTFGIDIKGLWPSEGSVSEDILSILAENNIKWFGTDEGILKRSRLEGRYRQYQPYLISRDFGEIAAIFRDTDLSDAVGFKYQNLNPDKAAEDLVRKLESQAVSDDVKLIPVILDGENAWEYYPGNAVPFFRKLYKLISESDKIETVRISDFLEKFPPQNKIGKLFAGSWINSDFYIWIGHEEDRKAWEYLFRVRNDLVNALREDKTITDEERKKAFEELYVAEGSDWFWWYGDDHFSGMDDEFDNLFRTHLKNIYKYIKRDYPEFLNEPVISKKDIIKFTHPTGFLQIEMDGRVSNYFEWLDAGVYDPVKDSGAATQVAGRLIRKVYFGFDSKNFYLRADFDKNILGDSKEDVSFLVEFLKPRTSLLRITKKSGEKSINGSGLQDECDFKWDDIFELSVPFNVLKFFEGEKAEFFIRVFKEEEFFERVPSFSTLSFEVPDLTFEWENWKI